MKRRTFVVSSAAVGTTLLAGCSQSDDDGTNGGDGTPTDGSTLGTFRLLISDKPADISDFDSLEVTLEKARVFQSQDDEGTPTATPTGTPTPTSAPNGTATPTNSTATPTATPTNSTATPTATPTNSTATPTGTPTSTETPEEDDDGESGGFETFDLGGTVVELTELVGDKALPVLETDLEAGTYSKIELHASKAEGVVDGDSVDVKIPSEKLQIVKPFEIEAGGEVSFVFDINVVKKGNKGYNLLPVIAKSGVVGKDVEVEEVEDDDATETPEDEDSEATESPEDENSTSSEGEGTPTEEDATESGDGNESTGGEDQSGGNQSDE